MMVYSFVYGLHMYQGTWSAVVGNELHRGNINDCYVVVYKHLINKNLIKMCKVMTNLI